jgi:hypothetical protein
MWSTLSGGRIAGGKNQFENEAAGNPAQSFGVDRQLSDLLFKVGERLLEHFAMSRNVLGGQFLDDSPA